MPLTFLNDSVACEAKNKTKLSASAPLIKNLEYCCQLHSQICLPCPIWIHKNWAADANTPIGTLAESALNPVSYQKKKENKRWRRK